MHRIDIDRSLLKYCIFDFVTCGIYGLYFIHKLAIDVNEMCNGDGQTTSGLFKYLFFSLITCSIYHFYWMYKLANRLQFVSAKYGVFVRESGTTVVLWEIVGYLFTCGLGKLISLHIIIKNTNQLAMAYNAKISSCQ